MMPPKLTLDNVKKNKKFDKKRSVSVADFVSDEEIKKLKQKRRARHARGKSGQKKFDTVDSFVAEVIARFGFETYRAWDTGEVSNEWLLHLLNAERARESAKFAELETVLLGTMVGVMAGKKGRKNISFINKIINENKKVAKGG